MTAHVDDLARTCYIDLLPASAAWGPRPRWGSGVGASKTLCVNGTSDAYTVWIVGRVSKMYFFDDDGMPNDKVSINIIPWTVNTAQQVRRRLTMLSQPQEGKCRPISPWFAY